jgi:hypothetical protein
LISIGVVKHDKKDIYQDSVAALLHREHDIDAGGDVDGLEEDIATAEAPLSEVLTAIPKVHFVFKLHVSDSELTCTSAQKYYSGCAFKPPATGGMARGSQCLLREDSCNIQH